MSEQPKITIVLLNYKRPQNIPMILEAIRNQTVKAKVFLWNNGAADVNSPLIDRYKKSEKNVGCMARWKLAKEAATPYVMSLDDDICFARNDVLEDVIKALEAQDHPNRIIGFNGACFNRFLIYTLAEDFLCRYRDANSQVQKEDGSFEAKVGSEVVYVKRHFVRRDVAVDIVKGRMMAFRRGLLDDIELPEEREDDIFLNAAFANKSRKFHRIPALLNDAFYELPEHAVGNWCEDGHYQSRERALATYFARSVIFKNGFIRYIYIKIYALKLFISRKWRRFK